jgi:arginine deiminase
MREMRIKAEWHKLKKVMMHRPGTEIDYAMLSPRPFLFERPFRTRVAIEEHQQLENTLRENGVQVEILSDFVMNRADNDGAFRKAFEQKVLSLVRFYGNIDSAEAAQAELEKNLSILDSSTLFKIMTLEPAIDLKLDVSEGLEYPTVYSNLPLANLYFMRDQQAVAPGGVLVGNMKRKQRMRESEITEFVLKEAFNEDNLYRITGNGIFEGGDYMPANDFCMIGVGSRTNLDGALQALASGYLEYDEVAIVENPIYNFMEGLPKDPMVNMHLDTYFNIAGDGIAVGSSELMKKAKVSIYPGKLEDEMKPLQETTLYDYLKSKDYNFIELGVSEQLSYSSNFLTLADRRIVTVNVSNVLNRLLTEHVFPDNVEKEVIRDMEKKGKDNLFPNRKEIKDLGIENIPVNLSELTGGYGGAHCMTAALER